MTIKVGKVHPLTACERTGQERPHSTEFRCPVCQRAGWFNPIFLIRYGVQCNGARFTTDT